MKAIMRINNRWFVSVGRNTVSSPSMFYALWYTVTGALRRNVSRVLRLMAMLFMWGYTLSVLAYSVLQHPIVKILISR